MPKFISGLKGDVTDNIFLLDDTQVVYPVGHNIVIYNMDVKQQKVFQCYDGTEGITAMALSHQKKWLAVAEKCDKSPIVTVYRIENEKKEDGEASKKSDGKTLKKKKTILSKEITQKAFISMAFAPKNDKHLVTLSCEPDQNIFIWAVDKCKLVCLQDIPHGPNHAIATQVSFSTVDSNFILVTGNNTYKFY